MTDQVLMTADTLGGVWTYSIELARALTPSRVTLATMGAPLTAAQWEQARVLRNVDVRESSFHLEWMVDPWEDVARAGDWLLALEREVRPDVVHLNGYAHAALKWQAPVLVAGHSCVLSWWRAVKNEEAPARYDRYRSEVSRGLRSAALVVAPTAAMLSELERDYGPFRNGRVIHNARSPKCFGSGPKSELILAAGRLWDEAKNIAILDAVAPHLTWPVYAAGETRHPDGRVRCLKSVRALGALDPEELASWFARAAVYALPSLYEPFGLSALEAALSGCALVLADIPSLREVWNDAALFVHPKDPNGWRQALSELNRDRRLREMMAARAAIRARTFSPERMAADYNSAYALLRSATVA